VETFKKVSAIILLALIVLTYIAVGLATEIRPANKADEPPAIKTTGVLGLRRLHLFRPDLIPYPLYVESYA
jgi:hypothetical protein